jgi:type II secretory pathway pseudopilin PulG
MELLIVVAILAVLLAVTFINWKAQINRAYDAQRKADLVSIQKAFEAYFNDHQCYPPVNILNHCGGTELQPYMPKVLCDPLLKEHYIYIPVDSTNLCLGYRLLARLLDANDNDISALGCDPTGCGYGSGYNYGVSSGTTVAASWFVPNVTPNPTLGPQPGRYACPPGGPPRYYSVCQDYGNPMAVGCPNSFSDRDCYGLCNIPANQCPN